MNGARHTGLLHDDGIRAMRVDIRAIAAHAAQVHGLGEVAARLQADALAAAALLSAYLDDTERLTLQLQLEQPRLALTADVYDSGAIRCRTTPPTPRDAPMLEGILFVLKSVRGREVYRGITAVHHDDLGQVLQDHLHGSDQVPARVRVRDGIGVFVERLPGQAEDVDLDAVLEEVWNGLEGGEAPLFWQCTCSREKVLTMLSTLGDEEIQAMIDEDGGATVECNFCRTETVLGVPDLQALLTS
ncbi:MAG: Hsp33 family molecular chaperone HslO [Myxococcales bacterium]|nr:Hsp33 family molecular chaperone HslO [Myxococcales bacterium]MCB9668153.1 Hsp33 family molecular chaperone HslO [Alphaproteobacteria bacterium]MCB9692492.1 Hsp33 family molecular chaperone HslO [Alphaproteobacteria bacterium]